MKPTRPGNTRPNGQIRQSQVVTTFGPGSMIDLPDESVMVAGLEYWDQGPEVIEPRLVAKLRDSLGRADLRLVAPPPDADGLDDSRRPGIACWQFPGWFITQGSAGGDSGRATRSRRLISRSALTKGKFVDGSRKAQPVVPVRFVRACKRGHISDINWYDFVHPGASACRRELWFEERGTSGDLSENWVRCSCGAERPMTDATRKDTSALGRCDGRQPWLGPQIREECDEPSRMLVRTASNAYFPQPLSVISIPDRDEAISQAVDRAWEHLQYVEDLDDLVRDRRRKPPVSAALEGLSDDVVLEAIQARRGGQGSAEKSVKRVEFEALVAARDAIGSDRPDGDFFARNLPRHEWDEPWMADVERVVLVHRLREVVATAGFTRFEASSPTVDGELEIGVEQAPLSRGEVDWAPAVENRGEGIFLQFDAEAIRRWAELPAVAARGRTLMAGFERWRLEHERSRRQFPGLPYLLLHTLSHQLITAISLECGYPASSIRERIYAGDYGTGILLYTGTPDAEGTMGGLVQAGRQIARFVQKAIDLGRLCSNDPVCAQHAPSDPQERRFLHGAACHGCLLIAETSCEQRNDFLDRALLIATVVDDGAGFFGPSLG